MNKLIILLYFFGFNLISQELNNEFVVGEWKVLSIKKTHSKIDYSEILEGLKKAKYIFNKDKTCEIISSSNNRVFDVLSSDFNQAKWRLNKNIIEVINKRNYIIEKITIKIINNEILFFMSEIDNESLVLEVSKIE